MIELEKTYLAKYIPDGLKNCKSKEIIDIYIPKSIDHPKLRIRKDEDRYEITKKVHTGNDASRHEEQTITLTPAEFEELMKLDGKKIHKIRYYYPHQNKIAEIDVFQEDLAGLVLVDFEFDTPEEKESFKMPDFCLADVTQEEFIAGGMLCGKSYKDIKNQLDKFNYKKLFLK